ncbi:MAG: D-alanyl-D-alanine carboxypeptidase, partial [Alphaproteobacteria bacterium]|nr:D-alanyl-D-alanine carboxypeptidase [Alphaproteobacteria bacterium]
PISQYAAAKPPTKIGLRPGATITVRDAIGAIVTKSANDISAAVGEFLGGSEDQFARMMTARARSLGMSRTVFRNASGLPDPEQVTTARDLSILGRVMRERFPQYFHFFGTTHYQLGRYNIRNHNRLIGRIEGVDGIKTGYTRASGFNLLTSAKRGNRRIVAVVLGGSSGRSRDNIMANLVENHIDGASTRRTATMIAQAPAPAAEPVAQTPVPRPVLQRVAEALTPAPVPAPAPASAPVRTPEPVAQPDRQAQVQQPARAPLALSAYTASLVRPAVVTAAAAAPVRSGSDLVPTASIPNAPAVIEGSTRGRTQHATAAAVPSRATTPATLRWVSGPAGATRPAQPRTYFIAPPAPIPAAQPGRQAQPQAKPQSRQTAAAAPARTAQRPAAAARGIMIQVGATDDKAKAQALIEKARSKGQGHLSRATPFTEQVAKGNATLYRARFAGLDERHAEAACKALKRSGMGCFTTRN